MNKRSAVLLGIFAIAGVVSSVWLLAVTYRKPIKKSAYMRTQPKATEPIFKLEKLEKFDIKATAPEMTPWDMLTEKEQKLLNEEIGMTREMTKRWSLGGLRALVGVIKKDKGY